MLNLLAHCVLNPRQQQLPHLGCQLRDAYYRWSPWVSIEAQGLAHTMIVEITRAQDGMSVSADRLSNMQHLKPVFVTLKPKEDDVVKMNAMVTDYASALNRKDVLGVRLRGLVGDDNHKVCAALLTPYSTALKLALASLDGLRPCRSVWLLCCALLRRIVQDVSQECINLALNSY